MIKLLCTHPKPPTTSCRRLRKTTVSLAYTPNPHGSASSQTVPTFGVIVGQERGGDAGGVVSLGAWSYSNRVAVTAVFLRMVPNVAATAARLSAVLVARAM